ncbi:hypothetical protein QY97_03097 [Bacillus thermotolerans]|nr:hypothetical protein QY97_03097 [Bacillus thermotolerans]
MKSFCYLYSLIYPELFKRGKSCGKRGKTNGWNTAAKQAFPHKS